MISAPLMVPLVAKLGADDIPSLSAYPGLAAAALTRYWLRSTVPDTSSV